jgi:hypothetical protein
MEVPQRQRYKLIKADERRHIAIKDEETGDILIPLEHFLFHKNGRRPSNETITAFKNEHVNYISPDIASWLALYARLDGGKEGENPSVYDLRDMMAAFPKCKWFDKLRNGDFDYVEEEEEEVGVDSLDEVMVPEPEMDTETRESSLTEDQKQSLKKFLHKHMAAAIDEWISMLH